MFKDLQFRISRCRNAFLHFSFFIVIAAMFTVLTNCEKKEDTGMKEALTRKMLEEISADSIESYVTWLEGMGTRFTLSENRKQVAEKIRNRFISMGYINARLDSFFVTRTYRNVVYGLMQYNVIASLDGTQYPDSLCILGGHYDSIVTTGDPFAFAPGAHDNASGTAVILEVARVMIKNDFKPARSVMFIAFGAEEIGLYGSRDFASDPEGFDGKISFMINNDMVAYETSSDPQSWIVNILDYENSHSLRKFAEKVISERTGLQFMNDNKYNKASDSYPFFQYGYKAIFFSSVDSDPYYHTVNDVSPNLNFAYAREIAKASCGILADKN
jgi:bacterial leucyl aminopeptidase